MPFSETDPVVARSRPAQRPSSVVFPLPEGPMIARESPGIRSNSMSRSTVSVPPPLA